MRKLARMGRSPRTSRSQSRGLLPGLGIEDVIPRKGTGGSAGLAAVRDRRRYGDQLVVGRNGWNRKATSASLSANTGTFDSGTVTVGQSISGSSP